MKKAQQEDLIISEMLDNIDKIKVVDIYNYDSVGNVYSLNDFFVYKQDTINYNFSIFLISFLLIFISVGFYIDGSYFTSIIFIISALLSLIFWYLYVYNVYVYSQGKYKKCFLLKNQKQIRLIIMQVETRNILNSMKN